MILIDVNVLVYAHRQDSNRHLDFRRWMEKTVSSGQPFSLPSLVRSGFLRIVTNPRIHSLPTPLEEALSVLDDLTRTPNHIEIQPGKDHWLIFTRLCREANARGDLVPDAYYAALAIECGGEWITTDKDYARFPGLRWRHPLDASYGLGGAAAVSAHEPRRRYRSRLRTTLKR